MALVVGNGTVATGMSPIVEAGLYADSIFIDGVSFSSKHNIGSAGQIQVVKYASGRGVSPTTPGSDFVDRNYSNTVIDINVNNGFQDSAKVPNYYEATMPTNELMGKTLEVTQRIGVGRQESALAALVDGITVSSDTTAITETNIKQIIVEHLGQAFKKHCKPTTLILSVDAYTSLLAYAGKDFIPLFNDDVIRRGKVGMYMGLVVIMADLLDGITNNYKYLDASGVVQTVDTSAIDFIMYDKEAYSIIDRLDMLRVKDSELFNGSKVQGEVASGFKRTNETCFLAKKH